MSLRLKLLLVALSTLALPWAGWQFVRLTEALLRQGQEQALLASAGTLAKAFAVSGVEWPAAPVLYVHRLARPITVDGYADDWASLRPFAQALGPAQDAQKLRVLLGADDSGLYLLAEVRDATRTRVDALDPRATASDHVDLVLARGDDQRRYLIASSAPGPFEVRADVAQSALPDRLAGVWQEDGSGYRFELRIPDTLRPQQIGIDVYDAASPNAYRPELRALLAYDERAERSLASLQPDRARARIVDTDGWLIADANGLDESAGASPDSDGWFGHLVYRTAIAPVLTGSPALGGDAPRLDAAEVWQALSGVASTSWRAGGVGDDVVLTAAVPLRAAGEVRGALVLEQANRALPLLANRALLGLAGATLAALVAAGLILLMFGASLSFRIRRLRNAVERAVRTSGRLNGPMPLADADDELGDLARSFGKLFDEVVAYTDYLRTLASRLSHELNTPLAIVKSSLDNLDHQALPMDARAYAARARDGAERLGKIVRAMSEAGRIERAMPFHGAPELIAQALDKLFDNARSFTPENGWIELALAPIDGGAEIRVSNSGPPLPASMQDRLFDSLVSVRDAGTRRMGETPHLGLGLYVVRLVAELHRGSATAHNLADGAGVEFALRLFGMPRRRLSEGSSDA